MTAYVVAAFAAALMLSSALVFIPQAAYAPPPRAHICNSHSPNGGVSGPPCGPLRAR
jgi:hypothetical protein